MPKPPNMIFEQDIVGACFMYRRRVYERIGDYNEDRFLVEDYDCWLRVAKEFKLAPLDKAKYFYKIHKESLSNEHGWVEIGKASADLLEPKIRSRKLSGIFLNQSMHAYCQNQKQQALKYLLMAIAEQPSRLLNGNIVIEMLKKAPKFLRHL